MSRLAVDAMGGDYGPEVTVPACIDFLSTEPQVSLILTGDHDTIYSFLDDCAPDIRARITVQHTTQSVAMDEAPSAALRYKKDSSLRVALDLLAANEADACVSAGNTGALMATAKFVLKMVPGVIRPAILVRLPTHTQRITRALDMGANVDSPAEQLVQFGAMGSILAKAVDGIAAPTVALLNVGEEECKGSAVIKRAAELLEQQDSINYIGFVEGNDWFTGKADVVVCDGLVGNIALKAVEGISTLLAGYLRGSFKRNIFSQFSGLLAKPTLADFKEKIDTRNFNGATLIGVNGVVIKSHGSADQYAFHNALKEAILQVDRNIPQLLTQHMGNLNLAV